MVVTNSSESPSESLRDRKRLRDMKRVQREAVRRFTADGFDAATVEEIAAAAEVSPMSVYRWFGTKEALVIWDEHDPPILAAVAARLADRPPLAAVRDAIVDVLDDVYDRERGLSLDRARLIYREPGLLAAAEHNGRALRGALVELFVRHGGLSTDAANVAAAVAESLLDVAIEAWQRLDGRRALAELVATTFATHEELT